MKIYLHIGKEWVEPEYNEEQDDIIRLNWTFDDLINPTNYISEYSYQFVLPITAKNDQIFSNIRFLESDNNYQSFKHNYRFEYIIQASDDVISNGEAILDEITDDGYKITLQGSLYTAFTKLMASGWDRKKADEDDEYYLFRDVEDEYLDRHMVKRSWDNANPPFEMNDNIEDEEITNVLTFVPEHQGRYKDDFDSTSWLTMKDSKVKKRPIGQYTDDEDSKIDVGDGLNEWEMQEYRSYEQPVGIYVQKLFEIYRQKCKDITDYDLDLDSRWYNDTFEYLQKLVYVLGRVKKEDENSDEIQNNSSHVFSSQLPQNWNSRDKTVPGLQSATTASVTMPTNITVHDNEIVRFKYEIDVDYTLAGNTMFVCCNKGNLIVVKADVIDDNNNTLYTHSTMFQLIDDVKNSDGNYIQYPSALETLQSLFGNIYDDYKAIRQPSGTDYEHLKEIIVNEFRWTSNHNGNVRLRLNFQYTNEFTPFATYTTNRRAGYNQVYFTRPPQLKINFKSIYSISENQRSHRRFNYEVAFGEEKPFSILLKYSKLIGLVWSIDDYSKRIIVKRRSDYFRDLITLDNNSKDPNNDRWTGFLDITKNTKYDDMTITPLSWKSKYVVWNYEEADDEYMKSYQEKYDRTFGSARIITENFTNSEEEELLATTENNTIYPSCIVQPFYRTYASIVYNSDMKLQCDTAAPSSTTDGEQADIKGNFYFRLANISLPASMHDGGYKKDDYGNWANISDDTAWETTNREYCWHSIPYILAQHMNVPFFHIPETDIITRSIPQYHVLRNGYNCQFADTYEIYYNIPRIFRPFGQQTNIKFVYDSEWADYVKEVYNVNNKTVKALASIDGEQYRRLKSVPLTIINGVAYLVTEINNWSPQNEFTEIKMRQIWNYSDLEAKTKSYVQPKSYNTTDGTAPQLIAYQNAGLIITTEKDVQVNQDTKNPGGMVFGEE